MDEGSASPHAAGMPKPPSLKAFGRRVRELRARVGLSQEAFAASAGLDRSYLGSVERGERNITLQNIARIAQALDLTVSDLFKGVL